MSVKYGKIEMADEIEVESESLKTNKGRFIIEPLEKGHGHTFGNSLRRIILTSIEAPAIISVRIEGISHEFMAVEGIVEDMTNIILNLKAALLRKLPTDDEPMSHENRMLSSVVEVTQSDLDKNKGLVLITLGDIVPEGYFEMVNPDLHIFTITKPMKRQVDLRIAIGRGYVASERLNVRDKSSDEILIDAAFSPVRLVNYIVENTRVGQDTDFDKLIIEINTDGRITPSEALCFGSQIGLKHFEMFGRFKKLPLTFDEGFSTNDDDQDDLLDKLLLRIDEIELSVRSTNCLSGANIETIAELVSIPERKMLEFRNFGKKSLNEIKAKLVEMNLGLGMDLNKFGITSDNVKEKIKVLYEERKKERDLQKAESGQKDELNEDE